MAGDGWAMLPSAAGVIDPLLSTGFPLTLLGIRAPRAICFEAHVATRPPSASGSHEYAASDQRELDATERLVAALYAA